MTGNENQADAYCKVYAFHIGFDGTETYLSKAASVGNTVKKLGYSAKEPAVRGVSEKIGGGFIMQNFELPESTLLKVAVTRNLSWGSLLENAQMILRMRKGAAHRKLKVKLLQMKESAFQEAVFEGRFDLLTPAQMYTDHKVSINPNFLKFHSETNRNRIFVDEIIEPEKTKTPTLVTQTIYKEDGEAINVTKRKRLRNIKIKGEV